MHGNLPIIKVDILKVLTQEDNGNLVKPIEDCEIKDAVFQMDKFKGPGPDDCGAAFFQDYWYIIHKDVCQAIKSFFFFP